MLAAMFGDGTRHTIIRLLTGAALLAVLAGCGPSPARGLLADHLHEDTRRNFVFCAHYGCTARWNMAITDEEWAPVRALFEVPATDAAAERERIALAIGRIERVIGPKSGTDADRPGATIITGRTRGQLDCIDEAHNTTVYLTFLEREGLLHWHKVGDPIIRGRVIDRWFHNTATVTDTASGVLWAVDSWFGANGEPADVVTADRWLKGWEPEKFATRTDR
ncbi:hypothetical protein [Iodidimonas sp. SYSU 1G8]|uniref:hypothetical protein n=1 Tax=Iodidimonas sp. SYSU 1G8 TaxID=3133967 RepID=UPI0031FE8B6B